MADCQIQCRDTGWGTQSCQTTCQDNGYQQPAARFDTSMYQVHNYGAEMNNIELQQLEIQRRQLELQRMRNGQ